MSFFFSFTFVGLVRVCICMQVFSVEQSVMELVLKLSQSGTLKCRKSKLFTELNIVYHHSNTLLYVSVYSASMFPACFL